MRREAAGFVVVRGSGEVLLLHSRKTREWGFPKGHRDESDESLLAVAKRELEEETAITDFEQITGFEQSLSYPVRAGVHGDEPYDKTTVYYLATCSDDTKVAISEEHNEYQWCTIEQARELLLHDDLRKVLNSAAFTLNSQ